MERRRPKNSPPFHPQGGLIAGFQWHDICSILARQSNVQVDTAWPAKVKILNNNYILHIGSRLQ
jgi:hypothetical protein